MHEGPAGRPGRNEVDEGLAVPQDVADTGVARSRGAMFDHFGEVRPHRFDQVVGVVTDGRLAEGGSDEDQAMVGERRHRHLASTPAVYLGCQSEVNNAP